MKRILFLAAAAAAIMSCNKDRIHTPAPEIPAAEHIHLTVGVEGAAATRATGIVGDATDEQKVNSLQVFVFNGEALDGYGAAENSKTVTIDCTAGSRDIYAVVNADDLSAVDSKAELLATVSVLDNDVKSFEMFGKVTETLTAGSSITVPVDRFAARVVVKKVTNALSSPALAAQTFRLESIHINNVAGDVDFGGTGSYTVSTWYNKTALQAANNLGKMTNDAPAATVASGNSYSTAHYFYAYPNDASTSIADAWSPRRTMLVLKVRIGSTLYDYPIVLPALESNKSYEIAEVKITRPGNLDDGNEGGEDEQKPVEGTDCSFTIKINDWTVVNITEGTTI